MYIRLLYVYTPIQQPSTSAPNPLSYQNPTNLNPSNPPNPISHLHPPSPILPPIPNSKPLRHFPKLPNKSTSPPLVSILLNFSLPTSPLAAFS